MRVPATASIVFLLASAFSLHGESIVSTYCRAVLPDGAVTEVSGLGECSIAGSIVPGFRFPAAEAAAQTSYSNDGAPYGFSAYLLVSAHARYLPEYPLEGYNTARAEAELNLHATTAGPVRSGLIDLISAGPPLGGDGGYRDYWAEAMIGDLFLQRDTAYCQGACYGTFPFVLGQPFDIHLSAYAQGWADGRSVAGGITGDLYVDFTLHELDGAPVDFLLDPEPPAPIPEPSTFLLLAPTLALWMLLQFVRRSFGNGARSPR